VIGRMDLIYRTCPNCHGNGEDPRKRTRMCPKCHGYGKAHFCKTCGEAMPCSGTRTDMLDQSYCIRTTS